MLAMQATINIRFIVAYHIKAQAASTATR